MSLVLRRTVVGGGDWRFDNPSGRHHESKVVETSVTATDNSPSQDYTHPDDQATLLHVTPGFKPFTVLPILFVLLLLLFLSFTLVGDASHSFFEHRRYSIN